jgi:hypothetical protein
MKSSTILIILVIVTTAIIFNCSAASNITFDPAAITVSQGDTQTITLFLDEAPQGLAGYLFSVMVTNPGTTRIMDVSYPSWAGLSNTTGVPGESITMSAVDLNRQVQAGATGIVLGTITVQGGTAGTSTILLSNIQMDADGGSVIFADADPGTITVSMTGIPVTWTPAETMVPMTETTTVASPTGSSSSGNGGSGGDGGSYGEIVTSGTSSAGEPSGSAPAITVVQSPMSSDIQTPVTTEVLTPPTSLPASAPVMTPGMQQAAPQVAGILPGGTGIAGIPWLVWIVLIILIVVTLVILYLAVTKKI